MVLPGCEGGWEHRWEDVEDTAREVFHGSDIHIGNILVVSSER